MLDQEVTADMNDPDNRWMQTMSKVGGIGLLILISTFIGMGLGYWLDSKLGTSPWLAFVMTLVGLAAGLYEAIKILIQITRDQ